MKRRIKECIRFENFYFSFETFWRNNPYWEWNLRNDPQWVCLISNSSKLYIYYGCMNMFKDFFWLNIYKMDVWIFFDKSKFKKNILSNMIMMILFIGSNYDTTLPNKFRTINFQNRVILSMIHFRIKIFWAQEWCQMGPYVPILVCDFGLWCGLGLILISCDNQMSWAKA